ncbi:zinc ABC transporter substrate-binding protein [Ruegeria lacuscaerulensis]|uniref:zinc ABC transporter substrate-binding protein n=1 Tax=Ruegeria lacuscaerulensis TaxID=55218 RepID=UPI00147BD7E8|nr:zinc ABC transporter substrate-binding protein [Ruegeria lacuscaerulensis]
MRRSVLCAVGSVLASQAVAEPPKVATDIAPVHSLVAQVMNGVGEPALIIPAGSSPHDHAMRPSEARALQSADVVFWVGEELTPWMEKPLDALSGDARLVTLLDAEGTVLYEFRDVVADDHHDHDEHEDHDGHDSHDEHEEHDDHAGHDDHKDHEEHAGHDDHDGHDKDDEHAAHEDHDDHASHDDDHDDHADHDDHGHDHDGVDPHAWLDPANGRVWVHVIAETLAASDPENAAIYRENAERANAELLELEAQIATKIAGMQDHRFITFHDAYQYFENRFGLQTSGSVSLGDASNPGPARLAALQEKVAEDSIQCAFAEPQYDTRLVETAIEGSGAGVYELDPLGVDVTPGTDHYSAMLLGMAQGYVNCASGS